MSDLVELLREFAPLLHSDFGAATAWNAADEIESLRAQVAKLTEERDKLIVYNTVTYGFSHPYILKSENLIAKELLTAAESRIAELESACHTYKNLDLKKGHGMIVQALSRKSNLDALEAYRDVVIDEVLTKIEGTVIPWVKNEIRSLKKGK